MSLTKMILYLYVCWAEAALAPLLVGPAQDGILYIHALPSLLALLKMHLYDLHSSVFATRMKLLCRFGRLILLVRPRSPCQTVAELQVNRNTPGRIVIERDKTADVPRSRREVRKKSWQTRIKRAATLKQPQLNGN